MPVPSVPLGLVRVRFSHVQRARLPARSLRAIGIVDLACVSFPQSYGTRSTAVPADPTLFSPTIPPHIGIHHYVVRPKYHGL